MKTINKLILTTFASMALSACSTGFFDKDNTPPPSPLTTFKPEASVHSVWYTSANSGAGNENINLVPSLSNNMIFTADKNGDITATNMSDGSTRWSTNSGIFISGGPTASENIVVAGSRDGNIVALRQTDGQPLWKAKTSSEILAAPAIGNNITLAKTIDGKITAYSNHDGHVLWNYQQVEPTLILRGSSAPTISNDSSVIGFANGNLIKLTLQGGSLIWQHTVAIPQGSFSIERMVDIDSNPLIYDKRVYAATYQGRISALDLSSGKEIWTHDISSFTGIAADGGHVYVTDSKSNVWSFDANTGAVAWRQLELASRNISGPAIIGNYIVVGDYEGYLHWMNKQDGHFVARTKVNNSGISTAPVVNNNTLYVLTKDGHLAAYTIT